MQSLARALPPPGRGRRGWGGRGRQGLPPITNAMSGPGGAVVVVRDTEFLLQLDGKLQSYQLNPSSPEMVRLAAQEKAYSRYRIRYLNVAYKSLTSTATAGSVSVGVLVGPKSTLVASQNDIMKLRPSFSIPVWKNDTISVGSQIDSSRYMFCGDTTADGIACTIYVFGTKDAGIVQVSYEVELAYPKPFPATTGA